VATTAKAFACPRPDCTATAEVLTYCRHGRAANIAVGNWMRPITQLQADAADAFDAEVDAALISLYTYAAERDWVRAFELRSLAAAGKSLRAVNLAYALLVKNGDLEEGASDFVRLAPAVRSKGGASDAR
jgi:hypothetical protein